MKAKVQGARNMEKTTNMREIGQLMSVAIASVYVWLRYLN